MPHLIDLHFQDTPGVIASYVVDTGDGLAVVDTGPTSTLGALEEGLGRLGAGLRDIRHILLTHIHFDHAGAAGTLLERLPKARVYVHERGAAHLARPERLLSSATQIYGNQMERLWGQMLPLDPDQMTVLAGGEGFRVGTSEVQALYTPGHAVHHLSYHVGDDLFVGDVGGIRLATQQAPRAPTPPPDINLEHWHGSISTLQAADARTLHLAHFGSYPQEKSHWQALSSNLDTDAGRVRDLLAAGKDTEYITAAFTEQVMADLADQDADLPERYAFACPPWMSVQGLVRYWQRRATRESPA